MSNRDACLNLNVDFQFGLGFQDLQKSSVRNRNLCELQDCK